MAPENDGMTVEELNIEQSRKPEVFISYSSKNGDVANQVVAHLEQHGIRCWIAPRNVTPGKEWVPAIQEALREAKVFVLIYTAESNASRQVMNEVALAFNAEKITVPLCLTNEEMNDELKYYLTRVHWLNAVSTPMEESLNELLKYVERGLGRQGTGEASPAENAGSFRSMAGNQIVGSAQTVKNVAPASGNASATKKKKGKLALWIGIAAAALLCVGLGCFAFFNHQRSAKNPEDLMEVGLQAFYYGNRGTEDAEKASTYFEESAEKGVADAYYYLGQLKELDYDFQAAKEYYEEGVDAGSDLCRLGLGYLYQRGYGVKADYEKAWKLYCEAAEHDFVEADYYRGKFVRNGLSGQESSALEAEKYYKNVIKYAEDPYFIAIAHNELGLLYKKGSSEIPRDYEAAIEEFEKVQEEDGMPYLYSVKTYNLALTYQAMREEVKAEEYFTKYYFVNQEMSDAGNAYATYWRGVCLRHGFGTKKDPNAAAEWFLAADAAVKEKNPKACCYDAIYDLAMMNFSGEGDLEPDYGKTMEYLKEAANAGYGKAANAIGDMYVNGYVGKDEDGNPDIELARQWYEKAIDYGSTVAYCNIGYIYEKGTEKVPADSAEAKKWYQLGAAAGNARCMYNLGLEYQHEEDYESAFYWYQKAADLGEVFACYMVAQYYEKGGVVEQSDEKAFQWYLTAADGGDLTAIEKVANAYELGEYSQEINQAEALRYFLKGDELGSITCTYYCGLVYLKGIGAKEDPALAAEYFLKAAKAGNVKSMTEYGTLLLYGAKGVEANEEEGVYWMEEARKKGDLGSVGVLADYYYDGGKYEKAFPYVLELCQYEVDDGTPYLVLGEMYFYEMGTEYDELEAAKWLAKAYEKGSKLDYLEAYFLGVDYFYGNNLRQDYNKAFLLFQSAANESHESKACMMLGVCYYAGVGVEEDDHEALKWLGSAIDGGGLDEDSEAWCRSVIQIMVKNGTVSAEEAGKWLE